MSSNKIPVFDLFPVNDTHPHQEGEKCPCCPQKKLVKGKGIVYFHNAYDGRELHEKAEQNIKENTN